MYNNANHYKISKFLFSVKSTIFHSSAPFVATDLTSLYLSATQALQTKDDNY